MNNFDFSDIPKRLCENCERCQKYQCDNFKSYWDELPEFCELDGWMFLKREKIKQKIRIKKEQLLVLNIKLKTANSREQKKIQEKIKRINKSVAEYEQYGSKDW